MKPNPYAAIADIKARQLKFLDDTVSFYNLGNRAVCHVEGCIYTPRDYTPGCAIGRWSNTPEKLNGRVRNEKNWPYLPKWMQEMSIDFLQDIQLLHDRPRYWTTTGLSREGKIFYKQIKLDHL